MSNIKTDALKSILKNKDKRVADYKKNSEKSFREMIDTEEEVLDTVESGMTMEEKEDKAAEILRLKRKEMGYLE